MGKFYEGCFVCAFCEKSVCPERCFECARPQVMKQGWIHSLGFYFARFAKEHRNSKWSQAIVKLKSNSPPIIATFGKIVACYMEREFVDIKPYLITSVPGYSSSQWLFDNFERSATEFLLGSVFANLEDRRWIDRKQILTQTQEKGKKQHCCKTDFERRKNIRGIYTVLEPNNVKGQNIVLLDDVITSGATMRECADLLLEAGAKEVVGIVLARTYRMSSRLEEAGKRI